MACHVALRPQFSHVLRKSEEIVICESCSRILYYQDPDSTDAEDPYGESAAVSS